MGSKEEMHIPPDVEGIMGSKTQQKRSYFTSRLGNAAFALFCVFCYLYFFFKTGHFYIPTWLNPRSSGKPGSITWIPCPEPSRAGIDCGVITVPKDYFDESAGTANIAFARIRAVDLPKKGSVMLNPGGPGGSGMQLALGRTAMVKSYIGGSYDLIGFDPRGIGMTTPKTQCFSTPEAYQLFLANTILERGFTVSSTYSRNITSHPTRTMLVRQNREFLAMKQAQAALCAENMGDELKYMGTANVVRDMDFMTQIFDGPQARINYWGGSYGSILGAYLVNMLPNRVGYVTIDGIADPVSWANEPSHKWHTGWVHDAEKTYEMFLRDCSQAGPDLCPLTKLTNEPPAQIEKRIELFLDELIEKPLPVPHPKRAGYLTSGAVRAKILMILERPVQWQSGSRALSEAMAGNGTAFYNSIMHPDDWYKSDLARLAVTCIDSPPPASPEDIPTAEDLTDEMIHAMSTVSHHFGASVSVGEPDGGCQYWPTRGKGPERFTGPWNASLDIPMLIVSNTHDPITPMASGLLINSLMPQSSRMIVQNGPGHCSSAMASLCTMKHVRDYYTHGILPKNGTTCTVEHDTFSDPNAKVGAKGNSITEEEKEMIASIDEYERAEAKMVFGY